MTLFILKRNASAKFVKPSATIFLKKNRESFKIRGIIGDAAVFRNPFAALSTFLYVIKAN